ncbi:MAG: ERAP1-like C-terminal domain-containing protein, partial [Chthoniobacterales bacterium]
AAPWTQQPGFPIVKVQREAGGKATLTQERFTVNFPDAPALQWKIPVTYEVVGSPKVESFLMTTEKAALPGTPPNSIIKLNAEGAGNYRVQYDEGCWKSLLAHLAKLSAPDRVNLLSDAWALVQARRAPFSHYAELIAKLPPSDDLAEREQIINVFDFVNRLLAGEPRREEFQKYAQSVLRPTFDQLGWEAKGAETPRAAALRTSLINALGDLNDQEIVDGCRERFQKFVSNPSSLAPDLRPSVLAVVGRYADDSTATILHELGRKTTSTEEKQNYYDALASALDPKIAARTLEISLGSELPTSRALFLVSKIARQSEHPEVVWNFARSHMKPLLAKSDALGANSFAPSLFTFFSDVAHVAELQNYAKSDLPPAAAKEVSKAVDELTFRAEFKSRLLEQMSEVLKPH